MRILFSTMLLCALMPFASFGEEVDVLDFSFNGNDGIQHDLKNNKQSSIRFFETDGGAQTYASSYTSRTGDWNLSWGSVTSERYGASTNYFATIGGEMVIRDWGGVGTLESATAWQVTEDGTIDVSGVAAAYQNGFDTANEGITWFYSINGGDNVQQFVGGFGAGDASYTFSDIAVSAGDQISYGFAVEIDGDDSVYVSSVAINFFSNSGGTGTPEPTSLLMFGSLALFGLRRRKRPAV